jgi:hypothetical protein
MLMKCPVRVLLAGSLLAIAVPAVAQTPAPSPMAAASEPASIWYLGLNTGPAVVERFGGVFGLEGGRRLTESLDAVAELTWTSNVVTNRQLGLVDTLAVELGRLQGAPASGSMKVPALYGGLGLRWRFDLSGKFRPYVIGTLGGTRTNRKPTITLDGVDVTGTADQYGVTLGQDVIGRYASFTISGGLGFIMNRDPYYFDFGVRLASIHESEQTANAARLVLGAGYRF